MNKPMVKKVLLIVILLGVAFAIINWQMKKPGTSPTSTTAPKQGFIDKLLNKKPATPTSTTKPAATPTVSAPVFSVPNIYPVYQNKVVPPSLTRYHRYQIDIPAGGYAQKLIVAIPASLDFQTLTRVDRAALNQSTWKDNNYNYISTLNPTGSYLTEFTTPAEVSMQYSCSAKDRVATCVIQPTK